MQSPKTNEAKETKAITKRKRNELKNENFHTNIKELPILRHHTNSGKTEQNEGAKHSLFSWSRYDFDGYTTPSANRGSSSHENDNDTSAEIRIRKHANVRSPQIPSLQSARAPRKFFWQTRPRYEIYLKESSTLEAHERPSMYTLAEFLDLPEYRSNDEVNYVLGCGHAQLFNAFSAQNKPLKK